MLEVGWLDLTEYKSGSIDKEGIEDWVVGRDGGEDCVSVLRRIGDGGRQGGDGLEFLKEGHGDGALIVSELELLGTLDFGGWLDLCRAGKGLRDDFREHAFRGLQQGRVFLCVEGRVSC